MENLIIRKASGLKKAFMKRLLAVFLAASAIFLFSGSYATANGAAAPAYAADVSRLEAKYLVPIGRTAGIKIYAGGVMVVEFAAIKTENGELSPAQECGLKIGDLIIKVGKANVESMYELQTEISKYPGKQVSLTVLRENKSLNLTVIPRVDTTDSSVKIGAWVRDSMAGIGTITFYDPKSGVFGALGHGISDGDTGTLMPLASGCLIPSSVVGINKGENGKPGELIGIFETGKNCGSLYSNCETGLYGTLKPDELYPDLLSREPIPVGGSDTVSRGSAYILSNIAGENVEKFEIEIIKIINTERSTKNLYIRVIDPVLLSQTGGIVQGMSGSPIIQNGRIIGAVTHVLINDPEYGYGILLENMLENASERENATAA